MFATSAATNALTACHDTAWLKHHVSSAVRKHPMQTSLESRAQMDTQGDSGADWIESVMTDPPPPVVHKTALKSHRASRLLWLGESPPCGFGSRLGCESYRAVSPRSHYSDRGGGDRHAKNSCRCSSCSAHSVQAKHRLHDKLRKCLHDASHCLAKQGARLAIKGQLYGRGKRSVIITKFKSHSVGKTSRLTMHTALSIAFDGEHQSYWSDGPRSSSSSSSSSSSV